MVQLKKPRSGATMKKLGSWAILPRCWKWAQQGRPRQRRVAPAAMRSGRMQRKSIYARKTKADFMGGGGKASIVPRGTCETRLLLLFPTFPHLRERGFVCSVDPLGIFCRMAGALSGWRGFVFQFGRALLDEGHHFGHHLPVCPAACGLKTPMQANRQIKAQAFRWLCRFCGFHHSHI
jgi:hypothetical protein